MLQIRRLHAYFGLFIAPSVLFFALSGFLQIFSLHEAHGAYRPPVAIRILADVHKDQVLSKPRHGGGGGSAPAQERKTEGPPRHEDQATPKVSTLLLKWFFALVALGLISSTGLGLWIGLRFTRRPRLSWGLLAAGALIPLVLLFA